MSVVAIGALISGGWALLRYALALPRFVRYLRRARITSIPKGPTPPLSLVKSVRGDVPGLEENLVRTLRQNYPDFEVIFAHRKDDEQAVAAIDAARTQVPDVEVRASTDGAQERRDPTVWASASVRPDPLYLRDAANGLQEGDVVTFPPVLFGLRSLGARLWGLLCDVDFFLILLRWHARVPVSETIAGIGPNDTWAPEAAVLARRAARCFVPVMGFGQSLAIVTRWFRRLPYAPSVSARVSAVAPLLMLATAIGTPHTAWAVAGLAAHTFFRIAIAVVIDFRFCWDRSLVRSLPLLPLLWVYEPLAWIWVWFAREESQDANLVRA